MSEAWSSVFRLVVGIFWLYFASTKWQGVGWMRGLIQSAGAANPIPGLHELLIQVVAPNWLVFAIAQTVGETVVGILLILGLATRWAGIGGFLLAVNLALVVAFEVSDPGFRWLYYLAVLVNAQVIVSGAGPYALSRFGWVPAFLR
ncbi:MAG TPA: DoxX family membrane protein [Candidatus Dormibacteraeota bacterium]|jgi:uncharacterized membrane protein YphA (DoxX/SURF4 family)|nr:DoxX family membrane protein [Candidatus Dormibacteraeota bacterium]